jgi:hypothetical protein
MTNKTLFALSPNEANLLAVILDGQERLEPDDEQLLERLRQHANPPWQREPFTDKDRKELWQMMCEEIRGDIGEAAREACDQMSLLEALGHCVNLELLLPYHKLTNVPDGMTAEELLTEIAEEPAEDHADLIRFKLLVEDETVIGGHRITDLGVDVLQEFY